MATHADIITRTGTDAEVAQTLGVNLHQVRDWRLRDSIPAERWHAIAKADMATLDELAEIAAAGAATPSQSAA